MKAKVFVLLIGMCSLLALAGCGASSANPPSATTASTGVAPSGSQPTSVMTTTGAPAASTPTSAAQPTSAAAVPSGKPNDVILNSQRALLNVKAYRTRMTSTLASGRSSTTLIEFIQPDRVHMTLGSGVEYIAIKSQGTWQKVNGVWSKSASDMGDTIFAFRDPKVIEELEKSIVVEQAKFIGPDLLDGKPMFVYQYGTALKGAGAGGSDLTGTYKLWVGVTDSLPYKLEGESDSVLTKGEKTKILTIYEYDPNIKIEKPI